MNCSRILKKLSAYVDNEVSEQERRVISEHLKTCPRCQAELEQLLQISRSLDTVEHVETPPYFVPHLKQKLADRQSERGIRFPFIEWIKRATIPAFTAVCIVLALITGSSLGKTLYQTQVERIEAQETEVAQFLGISSLDEVSQGPIASSFENLLTWEEQ